MIVRRILNLFILSLVVCICACNPDKNDPINPTTFGITLEISENPEKLHNEVTLYAKVNSDANIKSVEFYLDEKYIGGTIKAPFEFQWDTRNEEDGIYQLKAVAYNESGNSKEAAQEVTVKNTLMTIEIEDSYIFSGGNILREGWIFLSDKHGNIVGEPQQIFNGRNLTWQRPAGFNSDTLYLNQLHYATWSPFDRPETTISFKTYPDLVFDHIILKAQQKDDIDGKANISIENDFDNTKWYLYYSSSPRYLTNSISWLSTLSWQNSVSYSVGMRKKILPVLSMYEYEWSFNSDSEYKKERKRFYRWDELEAGNNYNFHTNEYKPMKGHSFHVPFNYKQLKLATIGYLNNEDILGYEIDDLYLSNNEINTPEIFYADEFNGFSTIVTATTENKLITTYFNEKAPVTLELPNFNASVNSENQKNIQVTTNGNYDGGTVSWGHLTDNESEYLSINREVYFSTQSDVVHYKMPDIPGLLLDHYPELSLQLDYQYTFMLDYKSLHSYKDLLQLWFTDTFKGTEYREYSSIELYPDNSKVPTLKR